MNLGAKNVIQYFNTHQVVHERNRDTYSDEQLDFITDEICTEDVECQSECTARDRVIIVQDKVFGKVRRQKMRRVLSKENNERRN